MLHSPGAQPTAIAYCGLGLQHTCFVGLFSCTIPVLFLDCQGLEHLVFNHGIFFFFPFSFRFDVSTEGNVLSTSTFPNWDQHRPGLGVMLSPPKCRHR